MNSNDIKNIIAKYAKINVDNLSDSLDFKKDLHLDSIDLFQMIMEVEDKYKIKLNDSDLLSIKTVGDALNKINNAN